MTSQYKRPRKLRNFVGGVVGSFLSMTFAYFLMGGTSAPYPENIEAIGFLLSGSAILSNFLGYMLSAEDLFALLLVWIAVGAIVAPFAVSEWNLLRTVFWMGIIIATVALLSMLLLSPEFWNQSDRNLLLVILYAKTIIVSMISVPSSFLAYRGKKRWMKTKPKPIPDGIETKCVCGAVYRSNPLLCVECGRQLTDKTNGENTHLPRS